MPIKYPEHRFDVADAASLSNVVEIAGSPKWLDIPAGVEGTHLTFRRGGGDGSTMRDVRDDSGVLVAIPFAANSSVTLNDRLLVGASFLQIRTCSAASGTAQNQTGATVITLGVVPAR